MALADSFAEVEQHIRKQISDLGGLVNSYSLESAELLRLSEYSQGICSDLISKEIMSAISPLPYFRAVRARGRIVSMAGFKTVVTPSFSDEREYPQLVITSATLNYLAPKHTERYVVQKVKGMRRVMGDTGFFSFHRYADVFAERYRSLPVLTLELVTGVPNEDVMTVVLPSGKSGSGMVRWLSTSETARKAWQLPSISALGGIASDGLQRRFPDYIGTVDVLLSAVAGQPAASR